MFKYGSFRHFLLKFVFGVICLSISTVTFISLSTYSENDPGFKTLVNNSSGIEINNYFGLFGSYLSSYLIVIIGHLSYVVCVYLFVEGFKLLVGFNSRYIVLRFILNILGVLLISSFIYIYGPKYFSAGLISIFFSDFISEIYYIYSINQFFTYIINFFFLSLGLFLVIFSFRLKLVYFSILSRFFRFLKYFKGLFYIFSIFNLLKKKSKLNKTVDRNEPTIDKTKIIRTNFRKKTIQNKQEDSAFKFSLPDTSILSKSSIKNNNKKDLEKINNESVIKLERTLSEYGVDGKVVGYKSGPIVTLFEFIPNAGIKSSKVIGLSDDIARAMSSYSARISSQPGKTSLGIEIPNLKRDSVYFGDLVDDNRFKEQNDCITLALGKDISGEKIFADLEKMPHLLIAGTTGSGKSVGINAMILSILFRFKPNECKLILIDPKMLELSVYEDIPHLLTPVVTDPKKAVFALKWIVREMENRYKLMSSVNVKNIYSYNNKVLQNISTGRKLYKEVQTGIDDDTKMPIIEKKEIRLEKMPFIVVVIDEMADLMMVAGKEVESLVQRLAQMARASGIHLITATQRPSVDVITGTIKANFPSRISYKVASKFDSRTILNEMGAEQLLGSGDMLLLENGGSIKRLHGGFVSEAEVEKIVNSIKKQARFDYKNEISLKEENNLFDQNKSLMDENYDELYNKAVDIVVKQQKVSTSYIQRYLQIGYNRAARIVEKMEDEGIITEANNAGKRDVLKKA